MSRPDPQNSQNNRSNISDASHGDIDISNISAVAPEVSAEVSRGANSENSSSHNSGKYIGSFSFRAVGWEVVEKQDKENLHKEIRSNLSKIVGEVLEFGRIGNSSSSVSADTSTQGDNSSQFSKVREELFEVEKSLLAFPKEANYNRIIEVLEKVVVAFASVKLSQESNSDDDSSIPSAHQNSEYETISKLADDTITSLIMVHNRERCADVILEIGKVRSSRDKSELELSSKQSKEESVRVEHQIEEIKKIGQNLGKVEQFQKSLDDNEEKSPAVIKKRIDEAGVFLDQILRGRDLTEKKELTAGDQLEWEKIFGKIPPSEKREAADFIFDQIKQLGGRLNDLKAGLEGYDEEYKDGVEKLYENAKKEFVVEQKEFHAKAVDISGLATDFDKLITRLRSKEKLKEFIRHLSATDEVRKKAYGAILEQISKAWGDASFSEGLLDATENFQKSYEAENFRVDDVESLGRTLKGLMEVDERLIKERVRSLNKLFDLLSSDPAVLQALGLKSQEEVLSQCLKVIPGYRSKTVLGEDYNKGLFLLDILLDMKLSTDSKKTVLDLEMQRVAYQILAQELRTKIEETIDTSADDKNYNSDYSSMYRPPISYRSIDEVVVEKSKHKLGAWLTKFDDFRKEFFAQQSKGLKTLLERLSEQSNDLPAKDEVAKIINEVAGFGFVRELKEKKNFFSSHLVSPKESHDLSFEGVVNSDFVWRGIEHSKFEIKNFAAYLQEKLPIEYKDVEEATRQKILKDLTDESCALTTAKLHLERLKGDVKKEILSWKYPSPIDQNNERSLLHIVNNDLDSNYKEYLESKPDYLALRAKIGEIESNIFNAPNDFRSASTAVENLTDWLKGLQDIGNNPSKAEENVIIQLHQSYFSLAKIVLEGREKMEVEAAQLKAFLASESGARAIVESEKDVEMADIKRAMLDSARSIANARAIEEIRVAELSARDALRMDWSVGLTDIKHQRQKIKEAQVAELAALTQSQQDEVRKSEAVRKSAEEAQVAEIAAFIDSETQARSAVQLEMDSEFSALKQSQQDAMTVLQVAQNNEFERSEIEAVREDPAVVPVIILPVQPQAVHDDVVIIQDAQQEESIIKPDSSSADFFAPENQVTQERVLLASTVGSSNLFDGSDHNFSVVKGIKVVQDEEVERNKDKAATNIQRVFKGHRVRQDIQSRQDEVRKNESERNEIEAAQEAERQKIQVEYESKVQELAALKQSQQDEVRKSEAARKSAEEAQVAELAANEVAGAIQAAEEVRKKEVQAAELAAFIDNETQARSAVQLEMDREFSALKQSQQDAMTVLQVAQNNESERSKIEAVQEAERHKIQDEYESKVQELAANEVAGAIQAAEEAKRSKAATDIQRVFKGHRVREGIQSQQDEVRKSEAVRKSAEEAQVAELAAFIDNETQARSAVQLEMDSEFSALKQSQQDAMTVLQVAQNNESERSKIEAAQEAERQKIQAEYESKVQELAANEVAGAIQAAEEAKRSKAATDIQRVFKGHRVREGIQSQQDEVRKNESERSEIEAVQERVKVQDAREVQSQLDEIRKKEAAFKAAQQKAQAANEAAVVIRNKNKIQRRRDDAEAVKLENKRAEGDHKAKIFQDDARGYYDNIDLRRHQERPRRNFRAGSFSHERKMEEPDTGIKISTGIAVVAGLISLTSIASLVVPATVGAALIGVGFAATAFLPLAIIFGIIAFAAAVHSLSTDDAKKPVAQHKSYRVIERDNARTGNSISGGSVEMVAQKEEEGKILDPNTPAGMATKAQVQHVKSNSFPRDYCANEVLR